MKELNGSIDAGLHLVETLGVSLVASVAGNVSFSGLYGFRFSRFRFGDFILLQHASESVLIDRCL